jgi:hemolysin activation/secretion protein
MIVILFQLTKLTPYCFLFANVNPWNNNAQLFQGHDLHGHVKSAKSMTGHVRNRPMRNTLMRLALLLLLQAAFCRHASHAQPSPPPSPSAALQDLQSNREEIRRRQQAEQAEQESRLAQPRVDLQPQPQTVPAPEDVPDDPDGFPVDHVTVDTGGHDLPWIHELAKKYQGKKLGMAGIQHAIRALSNACIERGYVTTRILLPEQDIAASRTLRFAAIPGTVGKIRVNAQSTTQNATQSNIQSNTQGAISGGAQQGSSQGTTSGGTQGGSQNSAQRSTARRGGTWRNAFPAHSGALLNIRDIEQGLEQMKRVPTQDVTMDLKPGAQPGESDIVVSRANRFPLRGHVGIDNSGDKNTGQWQGSATAFWDNPLLLNDLFSLTYNGAVATSSGQGTLGNNITYSIPLGYWTAHASYNTYDYHQTVQGYYSPYESSGKSRGAELRVQFLAHRDQNSKTTVQARVSHRRNRNYIDDVELEVQRRDTSALEISLMHQRNMGRALLDASLSFRNGVPWFDATGDLQPHDGDAPTNRYHVLTADATLRVPFSIRHAHLNANTSFRAQLTGDTLFGSEYFSIGGRYTVRGFDGRQTLGAEKGLTLRNDVGAALWQTGQTLYLALDGGYVTGPASQYLSGSTLAGCALGLRGGWKSFYYDATIGCPLYKPAGLHTARVTCTAQAGIQF